MWLNLKGVRRVPSISTPNFILKSMNDETKNESSEYLGNELSKHDQRHQSTESNRWKYQRI